MLDCGEDVAAPPLLGCWAVLGGAGRQTSSCCNQTFRSAARPQQRLMKLRGGEQHVAPHCTSPNQSNKWRPEPGPGQAREQARAS